MNQLHESIESFAHKLTSLQDSALEKPWKWGSYDSEGVRFGIFRIIEMLDALAAKSGKSFAANETQGYLAAYRGAYWDLQSLLWGVSETQALQKPSEEDWDLRTTLAHIVGAELGFLGVLRFALENHRAGSWSADLKMTEADYDRLLKMDEATYIQLMESGLELLRMAHRDVHKEIISTFIEINEDELDLPSKYWEDESLPIRFRLGRFPSHMRQHTIQAEKTLVANGGPMSENRLLLRQVFRAFASIRIEYGQFSGEEITAVVSLIEDVQKALNAEN